MDPEFVSCWVKAIAAEVEDSMEIGSADDVAPVASDRVRRAIEEHRGRGFSVFAVFAEGKGFVALEIDEDDDQARELVKREAARIYALERTKAELARESTDEGLTYDDLRSMGLEGVWTPEGYYLGVNMKPVRKNKAYEQLAQDVEDHCIKLAAAGRGTYLSSACFDMGTRSP